MKPIYSTSKNKKLRSFYSSIHTVHPTTIFNLELTGYYTSKGESASWSGECSSKMFSSNLHSSCWVNNQELSMMFAYGPWIIGMLLSNARRRSRK